LKLVYPNIWKQMLLILSLPSLVKEK